MFHHCLGIEHSLERQRAKEVDTFPDAMQDFVGRYVQISLMKPSVQFGKKEDLA